MDGRWGEKTPCAWEIMAQSRGCVSPIATAAAQWKQGQESSCSPHSLGGKPTAAPAQPCAEVLLPLHYVRATLLASSQLLRMRWCPRPMHLKLQCAQPGPQRLAPPHMLGLTLWGSPQCCPSSHPVPSELLKSNSSRWLLAPGDMPGSQALLLDEDRTWLMVGAKNHIVLLHLEQPGREPEKVSVGQWVRAEEHRHLALRPQHSTYGCVVADLLAGTQGTGGALPAGRQGCGGERGREKPACGFWALRAEPQHRGCAHH